MMVIGVTGGIASGKSTVARMLAGRGILHIDADAIVHQLMRDDRATIAEIAQHFPKAVKDGVIHRSALAEAIGQNPEALKTLEHILHPRVRAREIAAIHYACRNRLRAVILDIPLLFETDAQTLCDIVIVAHAPVPIRRQRAFRRAGMNLVKWEKLLARQLQDHHRHPAATHVIATNMGKAVTWQKLQQLKRRWKLL